MDFPDWYKRYEKSHYGRRWHENVESWLVTGINKMGNNLLVIRFEDLKAETNEKLREIVDFLGIPADDSGIAYAINMSSLGQARGWEKKRGIQGANPDASFYRGGQTGQWKDYFTNDILDRFLILSEKAMKLGGYL